MIKIRYNKIDCNCLSIGMLIQTSKSSVFLFRHPAYLIYLKKIIFHTNKLIPYLQIKSKRFGGNNLMLRFRDFLFQSFKYFRFHNIINAVFLLLNNYLNFFFHIIHNYSLCYFISHLKQL